MYNHQTHQTLHHNSKSIQIKKAKQHNYNLGSNRKILQFSISPICDKNKWKMMMSSRDDNKNNNSNISKKSNSKIKRRDIIHITYKQFNLCNSGGNERINTNNDDEDVNNNKLNLTSNKNKANNRLLQHV